MQTPVAGRSSDWKKQIPARVDADVLAWLKGQGKGYQSRINAILRREMMQAIKSGKEVARSC